MKLTYSEYTAAQSRCIGAAIALTCHGRPASYGDMIRWTLATTLWPMSCHQVGMTPWDPAKQELDLFLSKLLPQEYPKP